MFVFLRSEPNGKIVQAVAGGGGDLIAKMDFAQGFESFLVEYPPGSSAPLHNGENVRLRANHGQYWSAKDGGGSTVRAVATMAQGWETFTIVAHDPNAGELTTYDQNGNAFAKRIMVSIRTSGGKWVSAPVDSLGNPKPLVALASTTKDAPEAAFQLVFTGGNVKRPAFDVWAGWAPTAS